MSEQGYEPFSLTGITVRSDSTNQLPLSVPKQLKTIGRVSTRSSASLVRPGTTADVYSIGAVQQEAVQGVGGGGSLNSAYSAIATVPGAYVPSGQSGYFQSTYIRGGDYDQVGYEVDGIPVNRAFDSYPSGSASSLGQQEVQVYTGAAPAGAEAQGLAGFINQTIKVGTYPGYEYGELGIGSPSFYHKAAIEIAGATSNRNFSYYIGADGYNQEFRYGDQFNGAGLTLQRGTPLNTCSPDFSQAVAPSCYSPNGINYAGPLGTPSIPTFALGSYAAFATSQVKIRNDVANLHFYFPHKDGTKDDLQLLGIDNTISTQYEYSPNDLGGYTELAALGLTAIYPNAYQYSGAVGVPLPGNYPQLTSEYFYPKLQSPESGFNGTIPADTRDAISNEQAIFKLGFTKTLGSSALFKFYGYSYYATWLQFSPNSNNTEFYGNPIDYELETHARGVSGTFSDQLGSKHLLQLQGSFTTASSLRDNNTQSYNTGAPLAILVNSKNPTNGICYSRTGVAGFCSSAAGASVIGLADAYNIAQGTEGYFGAPAGVVCGTGPCEYLTVGNGERATYNTVKPNFVAASLTDEWRPSSKVSIDYGIRLDDYQYVGTDTTGTPARALFFNSYNLNYCTDSLGNAVTKASLGSTFGGACPAGYKNLALVNPKGAVTQTYPVFQPRVGLTYSLTPTTVVRASYGRYTQAPSAAFEQYDYLQQNSPSSLLGFSPLGFDSPDHHIVPSTSNNFDVSFEHSVGDVSIKVSPFLRNTQNQIQQFYLDQRTGFVSGLNVGRQRSQGVEFELDKGNFANNGLSAKLSFAYTNSYVRYNSLPNGATILDAFKPGIQEYNEFTSACAAGSANAGKDICGGATPLHVAAPCYTVAGAAVAAAAACTAADVANPYYTAPLQNFLNPNQGYYPYDTFPGGIGSSYTGYGAPYVATLVLQEKLGKLAIIPNVQFAAGNRYGSPFTSYGIAPDSCTTIEGKTAGDPRYPSGAAGAGSSYNANTCGQLDSGIPDPATGKFDNIGQFYEPDTLQFGTQFNYEVSNKVTLTAVLSDIVNTCFGGSKVAGTQPGACGYGVVADGSGGGVGNVYNPKSAIQPYISSGYEPSYAGYPFNLYISAKVRI